MADRARPGGSPPPGARTSTREYVADYIRRRIFAGDYPAHARIPQDEVAAAVGMSRIPVREALVALEAEGLVAAPINQGAFVNPFTRYDIRCHFELRGFTHGLAARRAAELAPAILIRELRETGRLLAATADPAEFLALTGQFYAQIHAVGGSPRLSAALARLHNLVPGNFYAEVPGSMVMARRMMRVELKAQRVGDPVLAMSSAVATGLAHADCLIDMLAARGRLAD